MIHHKKILIFILFFNTLIWAQNGSCYDGAFLLSCETKEIKVDSFKFKNKTIEFFLIEKSHAYRDINGVCQYNGVIIILSENHKYLRRNKSKIFKLLSEKVQLKNFTVFSNCEIYQLSKTAFWHKKKEKEIRKGYIGRFISKL